MKKILIVEDEPGIVSFLKEGLEEEGYSTDTAFDGEAGLKKALSGKYDLILMDWMLPKRTGLEVTSEIRRTDKNTPILFLTAKDTVQDTILGLRSGANDYLKKPFSFEELLERIKVHFRNSQTKQAVIRHGPLLIDEVKHEVKWFETIVSLTQKEYDLLLFLVKNTNKVCTRKEILQKVWDIHFEYNSGVIDVYINSLRKKLLPRGDKELIETVRGIGYIVKNDLSEN